MKPNESEKFKKILEKEKKDLNKAIKGLKKVPEFGADVDAFATETSESEAFGNQLATAQALKERLADIESALNKIKKHEYGVCENCGKEISLKLLEANPESRLCQDCKKKQKKRKK